MSTASMNFQPHENSFGELVRAYTIYQSWLTCDCLGPMPLGLQTNVLSAVRLESQAAISLTVIQLKFRFEIFCFTLTQILMKWSQKSTWHDSNIFVSCENMYRSYSKMRAESNYSVNIAAEICPWERRRLDKLIFQIESFRIAIDSGSIYALGLGYFFKSMLRFCNPVCWFQYLAKSHILNIVVTNKTHFWIFISVLLIINL